MIQGVGAVAEETAGVRGTEEHDGGLPGLRETVGGGIIIQIPWEGADSFG